MSLYSLPVTFSLPLFLLPTISLLIFHTPATFTSAISPPLFYLPLILHSCYFTSLVYPLFHFPLFLTSHYFTSCYFTTRYFTPALCTPRYFTPAISLSAILTSSAIFLPLPFLTPPLFSSNHFPSLFPIS